MPRSRRLIEYLTEQNPRIYVKTSSGTQVQEVEQFLEEGVSKAPKARSKSYTKLAEYPVPSKIQRWHEFNFSTISTLFDKQINKVLQQEFDDLHEFSYVPAASLEIYHERSLEALIMKTTHSIVLEALERTSQALLSQKVLMLPGGRGCPAKVPTAPRLGPDWAGTSEAQEGSNILPGDTKLSRNWESKDIKQIVEKDGTLLRVSKEAAPLVAPLRQLLHYCNKLSTRYGYIITDKELVVCRVAPQDQHPISKDIKLNVSSGATIEWQSIPWENYGQNSQLTVNITLWVLHLLAANNGLLQWNYGALKGETLKKPTKQAKVDTVEVQVYSRRSNFQETGSEPSQSDSDNEGVTMSFETPNGSQSFMDDISRSNTRSTKRKKQARASEPANRQMRTRKRLKW